MQKYLIMLLIVLSKAVAQEKTIFLSDLEGNGEKWDIFLQKSKCFTGTSPKLILSNNSYLNLKNLKETRPFNLLANCTFFYLGDASDKGKSSIRILRDLVYLKETYPKKVFLIAGNRELNKLRFLQEITPNGKINPNGFYRFTQKKIPNEVKGDLRQLNESYFKLSFGAPNAMENRSTEIGLNHLKNNYKWWSAQILKSLRDDVRSFRNTRKAGVSRGLLLRYMQLSELVTINGDLIFSHGFIGADNLGQIPKIITSGARSPFGIELEAPIQINSRKNLDFWVQDLNTFYKSQLTVLTSKKFWKIIGKNKKILSEDNQYDDELLEKNEEKIVLANEELKYKGEELILYQEPTLMIRPNRPNDFNQESVVLGRNSNPADFGNPFDLGEGREGEATKILSSVGINVRISGHTPVGQTPLIQKISQANKPSWSINVDNSAAHADKYNTFSILGLSKNQDFFAEASFNIGGVEKYLSSSFKKDGSDSSKVGSRVTCEGKVFTINGELSTNQYLLFRSEANFASNYRISNLENCQTMN